MKNIYILCFLFISCILLTSCDEEKLKWGEGGAPGPVSDVTISSDNGAVILKWKIPTSETFDYVHIIYVGSKGDDRGQIISKYAADDAGYSTETIYGLADVKDYKFTLRACSSAGAASAPVEVTGTPLAPVFEMVVNTVKATADFGGIKVEWTNDWTNEVDGKSATILVSYLLNDKETVQRINASKSGVNSISGIPAEATDFKISVVDNYGNESSSKSFTLTPYEETEFNKKEWSIPGYDSGSNSGTVGYSSQGRENPAPKGHIISIFDDKLDANSFWSSSWSPQLYYPHWFIIDLGKESVISRVELARRYNDSRMQTGHKFFTCKEAGATDANNSEVWAWEDQGTFDFNPKTDDRQNYRLLNNPSARYLKVYFPVEKKGTGNDAMIGEVWVYGSR